MDRNQLKILDKALDLLLDTVCVVNAEGRFVFVSAAVESLLGYSPDELIGREMIEFVHPEDRDRTRSAADAIMRNQPLINFENRYIRKDGDIVHILWSARWSEEDQMRIAIARNVTSLKQAERMQRAVYRIADAAHGADSLPALCREIHSVIAALMPADNFLVALHDGRQGNVSFPYFAYGAEQQRLPHKVRAGTPLAEVLRTGQPLLTQGRHAENDHRDGNSDRDWLGVPLLSSQGVTGALVIETDSGSSALTEKHKDLLRFIAREVALVIERKQAQEQLQFLALHDALTGLPNRALFDDRLETALRLAEREKQNLALLYLDLDGFKYINDTRGHDVGDAVLRELAARLSRTVRKSDTVARIGGDEFAVLLSKVDGVGGADTVMEKIDAALAEPFVVDGRNYRIGASVGAAVYPRHGTDRASLFRYADARMYLAKRSSGEV